MPGSEITISQYSPNPPIQLPDGYTTLEVKGYYSNDYIAVDGATPVMGNFTSGQQGFYYSTTPTVNGSGNLVVPAHDVQPTVGSNPSARYTEDLWVDGAFYQRLMPNTSAGTGWQIPTVYGDPVEYDEIATYNRAATLVYPLSTYFTADETIQEILRLSGILNYAGFNLLGRTQLSRAPDVASVPIAYGVNDTHQPTTTTPVYWASQFASVNAAITAIGSSVATLIISEAQAAITTVSIPATLTLSFQGAGSLLLTTGQTITILSDGSQWPVRKIFFNATASLGTVSWVGNVFITDAWATWWGALPSATATVNSAAIHACCNALVTIGAGTMRFGTGTYQFNAKLTIGASGVGAFTGISLQGTNALVGTNLQWTGATNATAIEFTRGRYNRVNDLLLDSGVALGTTIGILLTGPANGTQTTGVAFTNVTVREFHVGIQAGVSGSDGSASEISLANTVCSENHIGFMSIGAGNTLNISMDRNSSFTLNTQWGAQFSGGSGSMSVHGGAMQANGVNNDLATGDISLNLGANGSVELSAIRFEPGNGADTAGGGGIANTSGVGSVTIDNCEWAAGAAPAYPLIRGIGYWTLRSVRFGSFGQDGWVVYNADNTSAGAFSILNSRVQNTNTRTVPGGGNNTTMLGIQFDPAFTGYEGLKITGENNFYQDGVGATIKFDNIEAVIGLTASATGKVYANRRINAFGQVSQDWYDFSDQDATPSVKWSNSFKAVDTGAVNQTTMDDPVDGQTVTIFFTNGNRTLIDGATQQLAGGANFVGSANDFIVMRYVGSITAWVESSRSVN